MGIRVSGRKTGIMSKTVLSIAIICYYSIRKVPRLGDFSDGLGLKQLSPASAFVF